METREIQLTPELDLVSWRAWPLTGKGSMFRSRKPRRVFVDSPGTYFLKVEGLRVYGERVPYSNEIEFQCELFTDFFVRGWNVDCTISLECPSSAHVTVDFGSSDREVGP